MWPSVEDNHPAAGRPAVDFDFVVVVVVDDAGGWSAAGADLAARMSWEVRGFCAYRDSASTGQYQLERDIHGC